ncbi:MAG TPA: cephalosporin hydroxylase, partial [Candidatus Latescibacteria bacterium]|nr:cephalosporin hydroxylase [Candidatus Latescibacterota bacterium]
PSSKVLVLLDSLHSKVHVLEELELYSPLVSKGSYIIVTDTHLDGTHWVSRKEGPLAAVNEFIAGTDEFEIDRQVDRYFISANISGYLKRVE